MPRTWSDKLRRVVRPARPGRGIPDSRGSASVTIVVRPALSTLASASTRSSGASRWTMHARSTVTDSRGAVRVAASFPATMSAIVHSTPVRIRLPSGVHTSGTAVSAPVVRSSSMRSVMAKSPKKCCRPVVAESPVTTEPRSVGVRMPARRARQPRTLPRGGRIRARRPVKPRRGSAMIDADASKSGGRPTPGNDLPIGGRALDRGRQEGGR